MNNKISDPIDISTEKLRWLYLIGIPVWIFLLLAGFIGYPGSKLTYLLFSLVFNLLLVSGIYHQKNYSYLFLVVFLWLGFWFKFTANFFLFGNFPFGEPVGNFNSSPAAWDEVACISIVGAIGVMIARLSYSLFKLPSTLLACDTNPPPAWYPALRGWIWFVILFFAAGFAAINVIYGILQVGLAPRTILHWPLNAAIAWMVSIGSAIAIATLLGWDLALRKEMTIPVYAVLVEALFSTISLLSRANYPFHAVPQIIVLIKNRSLLKQFSKLKAAIFGLVFLIFFAVSIVGVSQLRDYNYKAYSTSPSTISEGPASNGKTDGEVAPEVPSLRWILLHQLLVNRWIGLEGIMAISSHPVKNLELLREMMLEKRELGKPTLYQKISNSDYQTADPKYQFASLPGAIAFFFYSGSLIITMICMVGITLLIMLSESMIFWLTKNPLICSIFGLTAANTVAQFGVSPRQDIPYFILIFSATILICIVESDLFSAALSKLSPSKYHKSI
jgi:hypothetical protein